MRRNLIGTFQPVTRRSGVSASVMQTKRSVQTPVSFVRSLSGFALRLPVAAAQINQANGPRLAMNTSGLRTKRTVRSDSFTRSISLLEVEARAEADDLIAVAMQ